MIPEYNLTVTMLFANAADRDAWLAKIKTAVSNAKASLPAYKSVVARKGESYIEETVSENW
jgi:molybdopterin synthase catalytic subunit